MPLPLMSLPVSIMHELCLRLQQKLTCISANANDNRSVNEEGRADQEHNKGHI